MENVSEKIDELYQIYKKSKSVKLPIDLAANRIDPGDLYFTWDVASRKRIRRVIINCLRFMEFYMPFLLKLVISILKRYKDNLSIYGGNAYAKKALKMGANYAVIDNKLAKKGNKFLLVNNVRDTLINLAVLNRNKVNTQFIGITGSCGKSTTTKLINTVLSTKYSSEFEVNKNCIPVLPQNILNFNEGTDIGVIEMAAVSIGQIKELCEMVQPHCGLITCIGKAHLKGFKSIEGVLKGKGELFDYLISVNGHIFKNLNDSRIAGLANNYKNITTFGSMKDADICGEIINTFPFLTIKWYPSKKSKTEYYHMHTKLFGEYNLDNILAAISVGLYFEVPPKSINEAIYEYETINLRSQEKKIETNTIILDSYNANPTSMKAALLNFDKMPSYKKVAIIGDMLELGNLSVQEHRNMIFFIKNLNFDVTAFIGKKFRKARNHDFGLYFSNLKTARKWFKKQNFKNAHILLKGSRGIAVEKIVNQ
jgi:UDP-N-acetylmuramoyl-tripeptide--D-alanyl-D-alanine ligase